MIALGWQVLVLIGISCQGINNGNNNNSNNNNNYYYYIIKILRKFQTLDCIDAIAQLLRVIGYYCSLSSNLGASIVAESAIPFLIHSFHIFI